MGKASTVGEASNFTTEKKVFSNDGFHQGHGVAAIETTVAVTIVEVVGTTAGVEQTWKDLLASSFIVVEEKEGIHTNGSGILGGASQLVQVVGNGKGLFFTCARVGKHHVQLGCTIS